MDACIVVAQQRTQYGSEGGKSHTHVGSTRFSDFNCRGFQSASGLLPTPSKKICSGPSSNPVPRSPSSFDADARMLITSPKRAPIPVKTKGFKNGLCDYELSYSERWAGPAYCNSPPPSSVPIPKFSTRSHPTRTVSLELPVIAKEVIHIHPLPKSAPSSPRKSHFSTKYLFGTADNATKALRRILNLDMCDE